MKDLIQKYWKVGLYIVAGLVVVFLVYKGGRFIYKNTFEVEKYQYGSKTVQNQVFDQNVSIVKKTKRNGSEGEITLKFDKKDLNEEYAILVDKDVAVSGLKVSVSGKIGAGEMNVRMVDEQNLERFNRMVKGPKIEEVSTSSDAYSTMYRLYVTTNGAQNGDIKLKYSIY